MNRQRTAVALAAGAIVIVVVGLAVAGGVGPFGGDGNGVDDFPTATQTPGGAPADGGGGDGGDVDSAGENTPQPPFDFEVESIDSCGQTCRDVTATLENQQDRRATGVTVYSRIHAGRGTDGDVVWEGTHDVGTLTAGGSDTETRRVELSYFEALSVQRADGWITLVVTVETDRRTVTFQERRDVA